MKAKTEKIKVTVRREEVKELGITFPYYTRTGHLWCKFFRKNVGILVSDYSFKKQIEYLSGGIPETWLTNDPITEEEFNAKFNEVMSALKERSNEKAI